VSVALRTHTDVVMDALVAAHIAVHRGMGPTDPLGSAPYSVVYAGSATTTGTSADQYADVEQEVQVTSVGTAPEQAEWFADKVRAALVGQLLPPPAGRRWLRPGAPIGHVLTRPVERDLDFGEGAPMFYVVQIFDLLSTPA
jgi:hypothetical protein